jgi:hypothetical protein
MTSRWRLDPVALAGAALALVMALTYVALMRGQGDRPLAWVLAVLVGAAALAAVGSHRSAPRARVLLLAAAALLLALGVLALLTIGLPIIGAGVLCLVAAARRPRRALTEPPAAPDR